MRLLDWLVLLAAQIAWGIYLGTVWLLIDALNH